MQKREIKSFKDLIVWQKAADLVVLVYRITEQFPRAELYGITSQMRRSVVSISSNIAEGFKRSHKGEKLQFYNIGYGSSAELESQIEISLRLQFLTKADYDRLYLLNVEVSKMVNGLMQSLNPQSSILNSPRGYMLVELMVAMTIFIIGFVAVLTLTGNAVSMTRVITDSITANYLAVEGIEISKSIIDENVLGGGSWNSGMTVEECWTIDYRSTSGGGKGITPCPAGNLLDSPSLSDALLTFDPVTGLYSRDNGSENSPFYRIVHLIPDPSGEFIKIESIVAWIGRGGARWDVTLEDYFFNQQ